MSSSETLLLSPPQAIDLPHFDYGNIPVEYHAAANPDEIVTLYRGDIRGRHEQQTLSRAVLNLGVAAMMDTLDDFNQGDPDLINRLVDRHTSADHASPFISTTLNPEFAQFWAGQDRAIYKIEIPASRVIVDAKDTGRSGKSGELLIAGLLHPDEITAVKDPSGHDSYASELIDPRHGYIMGGLGALDYTRRSSNRSVKNEANWRPSR